MWQVNTSPPVCTLPSCLSGCPSLRSLKLGECDGLRTAVLRSSSLQSLQLSQCRWLAAAELGCPELTQVRRWGWGVGVWVGCGGCGGGGRVGGGAGLRLDSVFV
jgi:hypothetical protein